MKTFRLSDSFDDWFDVDASTLEQAWEKLAEMMGAEMVEEVKNATIMIKEIHS